MIGNEMLFKGAIKLGSGLEAKTIPYEFKSFETYDASKLSTMIKKVLGISEDTRQFQILHNRSQVISSSDKNYEKILDIKDANAKVIKTNEVIKSGDDVAKKTKIQTPSTVARMPRMDVEHNKPNISSDVKETKVQISEPPKETKVVEQPKKVEDTQVPKQTAQKPVKKKRSPKRTRKTPTQAAPAQQSQSKKRTPKRRRGLLDRVMGNKK